MSASTHVEDFTTQSYLFAKSLSYLHNKDSLVGELRSLKLQMVGTEKPSSTSGDPILHFVLGFAKMPSNEAITNYYRHNNDSSDGAAFSHMCIFLNKGENAEHLKISDSAAADKYVHFIKVKDEASLLEAQRMGYLLKFINGQKVGALCEMAARGNPWDAFILMSLLHPDHEITSFLRTYVWRILDLGWVDELISEKSKPVTGNSTKSGLNTMDCYLTVMDSLSDNKENLFVRSCLFESMRVYLLTAVCESEVEGYSRDLMEDYFNFISSEAVFLLECLPGLQKSYFKQASVVIRDFIRVVLHLCNVVKSDEVAKYEDDPPGVLSNLINKWITKDILPENGILAEIRKGIGEVLRSFVGDFLGSPDNIRKGPSYKVYILVALLIAEVVFRNTLAHSNGILIFDLLSKCEFKDQLIRGLLKTNVSPKTPATPLEDMVFSVRDCLLGVRNMLSQHSHIQIQSVADRHGLISAVESVERKENTIRAANDSVPSIEKTCDSVVPCSVYSDSGSSLRIASTQKDVLLLGKLQNKMVQDPSFSRDNIVLSPAAQLQPESIVSQDNMLGTKLNSKWEQPDTIATQLTTAVTSSAQRGNIDSHVQLSCVVVEKVKLSEQNEFFNNNFSVLDELDSPCMSATLSTSAVRPRNTDVSSSSTRTANNSVSSAQKANPSNSPQKVQQVFSSHFRQQHQSGWSSYGNDNGKKSTFGFASQANGDNGGGRGLGNVSCGFGGGGFASQASGGFGNVSRGYRKNGGESYRGGYGRGGYAGEGGRGNGNSDRRGERSGYGARGRGEHTRGYQNRDSFEK